MRLSTRGRYGARAILELALNYGKGILTLHDIAGKQEISERYLERLMATLVSAGLVVSSRGQHGGFILAKPPQEIWLSQVIQVVEGSIAPVACIDNTSVCNKINKCITRDIWVRMKKAMMDVLESITLQDMVKMHKEKMLEPLAVIYNI